MILFQELDRQKESVSQRFQKVIPVDINSLERQDFSIRYCIWEPEERLKSLDLGLTAPVEREKISTKLLCKYL